MSKNPQDYFYEGNEKITISAQEFLIFRRAIDTAVENGVKVEYPEVRGWVNTQNGKPYEKKPSDKVIESGKAIYTTIPDKTFSNDNVKISYDGSIFPNIYQAKVLWNMIHTRNVDEGVAVPVEELKKKQEEQGQFKINEE